MERKKNQKKIDEKDSINNMLSFLLGALLKKPLNDNFRMKVWKPDYENKLEGFLHEKSNKKYCIFQI